MTSNQLMTAAALGFAGFAVYYITRTPAKGAGTVTLDGQRQRDQGLVSWFDTLNAQNAQFDNSQWYGLASFTSALR